MAHPDPLASPGYTWTPGYPAPAVDPGEVHDRALVDGASGRTVAERPTGGALDGTFELPTAGLRPGALAVQLRAATGGVVTQVRVRLAAPGERPAVSADKKTYRAGEPIRVSWARGPGNRYDWLGLYREGEDPETTGVILGWRYVRASFSGSGSAGFAALRPLCPIRRRRSRRSRPRASPGSRHRGRRAR